MAANRYVLTAKERMLVENLIQQSSNLKERAEGCLGMLAALNGIEGTWDYNNGVLTPTAPAAPAIPQVLVIDPAQGVAVMDVEVE